MISPQMPFPEANEAFLFPKADSLGAFCRQVAVCSLNMVWACAQGPNGPRKRLGCFMEKAMRLRVFAVLSHSCKSLRVEFRHVLHNLQDFDHLGCWVCGEGSSVALLGALKLMRLLKSLAKSCPRHIAPPCEA